MKHSLHVKIFALLLVVLAALSALSCVEVYPSGGLLGALPGIFDETPLIAGIENPSAGIRGVWIASAYNLDFPSKPDLSESELAAEIDAIIETVALSNFNAIFFQVRPSADALYLSDIFPTSRYLYTNREIGSFDPLEYFIDRAHSHGIALHAWVNPMRISTSGTRSDIPHTEYAVSASDGGLYYDIGIPAARELIADGVGELVEKYGVDGVVFDDYFYPYPDNNVAVSFDDSKSFALYGGSASLADFRRANVNSLVRLCYDRVKDSDPDCLFGISPFGIWKNDDGSNGGSATGGLEAYDAIYCDALAWVRGGYVDYIAPQLYWSNDTPAAPFDELCEWWDRALDGSGVALLIGHSASKAADGSFGKGELCRQIKHAKEMENYGGVLVYGYSALAKSDEIIRETVESLSNDLRYNSLSGLDGVRVNLASGVAAFSEEVYISGHVDEAGKFSIPAATRFYITEEGYFTATLPLGRLGKNVFEFKYGDKTQEYSIRRLE